MFSADPLLGLFFPRHRRAAFRNRQLNLTARDRYEQGLGQVRYLQDAIGTLEVVLDRLLPYAGMGFWPAPLEVPGSFTDFPERPWAAQYAAYVLSGVPHGRIFELSKSLRAAFYEQAQDFPAAG